MMNTRTCFWLLLVLNSPAWGIYGDEKLTPGPHLPEQERTIEVQLERLDDFLCADLDDKCAQRAGAYFSYPRVQYLSDDSRALIAAATYLNLFFMESNPRQYWTDLGIASPTESDFDQKKYIGSDILKKAHDCWHASKNVEELKLQENAIQQRLVDKESAIGNLEKNLESANHTAKLAVLATCVCLVLSIVAVIVYLMRKK